MICNKGRILTSVPQIVPSLGMLPASTYSWIAYSTWCEFREPAAEQGFALSEEMQQKVAGSEATLCLWAQQRPRQSRCAGGAKLHSLAGAVSAGVPAPRSILAWLLCVQLLQMKSNCCPHLSASLRVPLQAAAARREAKPTVSSAAAGFLSPHSCIRLFLAVPPSKSKKTQ